MIPILYNPEEVEFTSNGIGHLTDAVSCVVEQELNGQYELELKYPLKGERYNDIAQRSIILVSVDSVSKLQPFRVYRITKPSKGIITVYARHIAYDLLGVPISPFEADSVSDALTRTKKNASGDCPFSFWTDKSTNAKLSLKVPKSCWDHLGGSEGSILDIYGGEYEFDRFNIRLYAKRGNDNGVTIRYGKNLTSLEQDENCANCYTGIYPYWANENKTVTLKEKVLHADGTFSYERIKPVDFSSDFEDEPTEDELKARGLSYIKNNDIGIPDVSMEISFIEIDNTVLERVLLGDTIGVIFPLLNVSATARVVGTSWNVLLDRYDKITVGKVKSNLSVSIANQQKEIEKKPDESEVKDAINSLTQKFMGSQGGYLRLLDTNGDGHMDELYIADSDDPNTARKVWRFNQTGWAASKNGYDGPFTMGATLDDGILAEAITAVQIVAGTIKSADSGKTFFLDLDNGILRMDATALTIGSKSIDEVVEENLDQESLFNALTNNGKLKGLIFQNGDVYLNASYINTGDLSADLIKGGTLILGGNNNAAGLMQIKDAKGNVIGTADNTGLSFSSQRQGKKFSSQFTDGSLQFKVNTSTTMLIDTLYDNYGGIFTGFCVYRALCFVPGSGGTLEFRYAGNDDWGDFKKPFYFATGVYMNSSLTVRGTKSRVAETDDYADRLLYCYETAVPMFGDVGCGVTDDTGVCFIPIDDVFRETVSSGIEYQVFLQEEGEGKLYVSEKTEDYFIVKGTKNLKFAWEIKAKQKDYEHTRLESAEEDVTFKDIDYEQQAIDDMMAYQYEMEGAIYESINELF